MATREERLLGYQLVHKTNMTNELILTTGYIMQGINATTLEDMTQPVNPLDPDDVSVQPPTVEYKKILATASITACQRYGRQVSEFATAWPALQIDSGLVEFQVTRLQIADDLSSVSTLRINAANAIALQVSSETLASSGALLCLYKPKMARHVKPSLVSLEERRVNAFQDVINAACLELRGLHEATGAALNLKLNDLKERVQSRINTAKLSWDRYVRHDAETTVFKSALDNIEAEMQQMTTTAQLIALAEYTELTVPQLPILRRWWNL